MTIVDPEHRAEFDADLVFAPDGIEWFEDAWSRGADIEGFPVCSIDDIIASKRASNRAKDRETLPRLEGVPEVPAGTWTSAPSATAGPEVSRP